MGQKNTSEINPAVFSTVISRQSSQTTGHWLQRCNNTIKLWVFFRKPTMQDDKIRVKLYRAIQAGPQEPRAVASGMFE